MKYDVEKIHSINALQFSQTTKIYFYTKKFVGVKFDIIIKGEEVNGYGVKRMAECNLTNRQFDNSNKWLSEYIERLEYYFKNECFETKLLLLINSSESVAS